MFLHVSVILFTGGGRERVSTSMHAGSRPPDPPGADPPGAGTPPGSACWEIRTTSGRYASYWNAILLIKNLFLQMNIDEAVSSLTQNVCTS